MVNISKKQALDTLKQSLDLGKQMLLNFNQDKDVDIDFKSIVNGLELNKRVVLTRGVIVELVEKTEKTFKILCWMKKGCNLSIHHHSNYDEYFKLIKGVVTCSLTGVKLHTKNRTHVFRANISHIPMCESNAFLEIIGVLV